MNCSVLAERINEFRSAKSGFQRHRLITLVDQETTKGARYRETIEYKLNEEEERKYAPDSLTGKNIVFGLSKFSSMNGRMMVEGVIIEVAK
jgi:hypothetical protein